MRCRKGKPPKIYSVDFGIATDAEPPPIALTALTVIRYFVLDPRPVITAYRAEAPPGTEIHVIPPFTEY